MFYEKTATPLETPELFYRNGQTPPRPAATTTSETDPAWENMPPALLEALGMAPNYDNNNNGVAELLVGQTETADVLLLNKVDLLDNDDSDETLEQIQQICRALNPRATILQCQFGQVPMHQILAVAGGTGVVEAGVVDDHRDAVEAAAAAAGVVAADEAAVVDRETKGDDDENNMLDAHAHHDHSLSSHHDHENHNHNVEDGTNPDCKDQSHAHTHQHHAEDHTSSNNCNDPTCTDSSHAHSHDHFTATSFACTDPDCNDPTHEHSHQHHHHDPNHAGIGSFVYRARRPFHPGRLLTFLRRLPVVRGLPKGEPNEEEHSIQVSPMAEMAIRELLRSKGFTWCADSNIAALYWSHAGTSFEMQCLGRWWATLPREQVCW
jgi:G3E family GTPase